MSDGALAVVAAAEVVKLLIMAHSTAIQAGMTPEQVETLYRSVKEGFTLRDPSKLPEV